MSRPGSLHVFIEPGDRLRFQGGNGYVSLDLTDEDGGAEWVLFLPDQPEEAALVVDSLEQAVADARAYYASRRNAVQP